LYPVEQGKRLDIAVQDAVIELQNNIATKLVPDVVIFSKPV